MIRKPGSPKRSKIRSAILLPLALCALPAGRAACVEVAPSGRRTEELIALREKWSEASAREHLRGVLRYATENTGRLPRFLTWRTGASLGPIPRGPMGEFARMAPRRVLPMRRLTDFGQPYGSTHIDPVMIDHIGDCRLLDARETRRQSAVGRRDITNFRPGSVVVKAIWRVLPSPGLNLGLWRPEDATWWISISNPHSIPPFPESQWRQNLIVVPEQDPTFRRVDQSVVPGATVPANYFYRTVVTSANVTSIRGENGVMPPIGSTIILTGLHIAVKAIPDWVWATFWWSDRPEFLSAMEPPWGNFAAGMTVNMQFNARASRLYNPYLETYLTNGLYSNCMTCHVQARYCSVGGIPPEANGDSVTFSFVERALRTDYSWVLARVLGPAPCQ